jgi:hypothetical protein
VAPIPNWLAAFRTQTLLYPDVVGFVKDRVAVNRPRTQSNSDPKGWKMPTSAIVYHAVGGPGRREFQAPIRWQSMQVDVYGADARLADDLYRVLWPSFMPQDMTKPHGFIVPSLGVAVLEIQELGSYSFQYDPETGWPRTIATWWVRVNEQPTNIVTASVSMGAHAGTGA